MKSKNRILKSGVMAAALAGLFILRLISLSFALPQVDNVAAGSANIVKVDDRTMQITASDKAIINYKSFDIGEGESVMVNMPNSGSSLLNRVTGESYSSILGSLSSNGIFFLINPNGIRLGPNANVDAAGLVLSTRDITNTDFLDGNYIFNKLSKEQLDMLLLNEGTISIRQAGFGVLIAGAVENQGTIVCPLGTIAMAGGDKITLNLAGNISVAINEKTASTVYDYQGKPVTSQIKNGANGKLEANGGTVLIKAEALPNLFESVINMEGYVQANKIEKHDGKIMIVSSGKVVVNTELKATNIYIGKEGEGVPSSVEASKLSAEELVRIVAEKATVTSLAALTEIYKPGTLTLNSSNLKDGFITLDGEGVRITYLNSSNLTLQADDSINTNPGVIIQANQVKLIAKQFGTNEVPLTIEANYTYIQKVSGPIEIMESLGLGTSIMLRGPPDGFGAIIYSSATNLTLEASQGSLDVAQGVTISAKSLTLIANQSIVLQGTFEAATGGSININANGNIYSHATLSAPEGTIQVCTKGTLDLGGSYAAKRLIFDPVDVNITTETTYTGATVVWASHDINVSANVTCNDELRFYADSTDASGTKDDGDGRFSQTAGTIQATSIYIDGSEGTVVGNLTSSSGLIQIGGVAGSHSMTSIALNGSITSAGNIYIPAGSADITMGSSATLTANGTGSGSGYVQIDTSGAVVLYGVASKGYETPIYAGILIGASTKPSSITLNGILTANNANGGIWIGASGAINIKESMTAAGAISLVSTSGGDITVASGKTLTANGTGSGTGFVYINTTGAVTLYGVTSNGYIEGGGIVIGTYSSSSVTLNGILTANNASGTIYIYALGAININENMAAAGHITLISSMGGNIVVASGKTLTANGTGPGTGFVYINTTGAVTLYGVTTYGYYSSVSPYSGLVITGPGPSPSYPSSIALNGTLTINEDNYPNIYLYANGAITFGATVNIGGIIYAQTAGAININASLTAGGYIYLSSSNGGNIVAASGKTLTANGTGSGNGYVGILTNGAVTLYGVTSNGYYSMGSYGIQIGDGVMYNPSSVTLNGILTANNTNGGIYIYATGAINIKESMTAAGAISLVSTSGGDITVASSKTLTANGTGSDNGYVKIVTSGAVTLYGVTSYGYNSMGNYGIYISGNMDYPSSVTLNGILTTNNANGGIAIYSKGININESMTSAGYIYLYSYQFVGDITMASGKSLTANGTGSGNGYVEIVTSRAVTLYGVTSNGYFGMGNNYGIWIGDGMNNPSSVTLNGTLTANNANGGIYIYANSSTGTIHAYSTLDAAGNIWLYSGGTKTLDDNLTAGGYIYLYSGNGGDITMTTSGKTLIANGTGSDSGYVKIETTGAVTLYGVTSNGYISISNPYTGIYISGSPSSVTLNGILTANNYGIYITSRSTININESIVSGGHILLTSTAMGSGGDITVASGKTLTANGTGIDNGYIRISTVGAVTLYGVTSNGYYSLLSPNDGIDIGAGSVILNGILTANNANGNIYIHSTGAININESMSAAGYIYLYSTSGGDITVATNKTLTANGTGADNGYVQIETGGGTITLYGVTSNGYNSATSPYAGIMIGYSVYYPRSVTLNSALTANNTNGGIYIASTNTLTINVALNAAGSIYLYGVGQALNVNVDLVAGGYIYLASSGSGGDITMGTNKTLTANGIGANNGYVQIEDSTPSGTITLYGVTSNGYYTGVSPYAGILIGSWYVASPVTLNGTLTANNTNGGIRIVTTNTAININESMTAAGAIYLASLGGGNITVASGKTLTANGTGSSNGFVYLQTTGAITLYEVTSNGYSTDSPTKAGILISNSNALTLNGILTANNANGGIFISIPGAININESMSAAGAIYLTSTSGGNITVASGKTLTANGTGAENGFIQIDTTGVLTLYGVTSNGYSSGVTPNAGIIIGRNNRPSSATLNGILAANNTNGGIYLYTTGAININESMSAAGAIYLYSSSGGNIVAASGKTLTANGTGANDGYVRINTTGAVTLYGITTSGYYSAATGTGILIATPSSVNLYGALIANNTNGGIWIETDSSTGSIHTYSTLDAAGNIWFFSGGTTTLDDNLTAGGYISLNSLNGGNIVAASGKTLTANGTGANNGYVIVGTTGVAVTFANVTTNGYDVIGGNNYSIYFNGTPTSITLKGTINANNKGLVIFPVAVTLGGTTQITTAGASGDDITFSSTVNGGYALTLNAGANGNISFLGAVGATTPLASLDLTSNTATFSSTLGLSGSFNNHSGIVGLGGNTSVGGSFINAGTINTNNHDISVGDNWTNSGTFNAGTGTVTLNGSALQEVTTGGVLSKFNILNIINNALQGVKFITPAFADTIEAENSDGNGVKQLTFSAGDTHTINNSFDVNGSSGNIIKLRSTTDGTQWTLNANSATVSYLDIKDSKSVNLIKNKNSKDSGNNTNWDLTHHLSITGISNPIDTNITTNVTVTSQDAYNDTATGYTGTISFSSSDSQATLPGNYAFQASDNGTHTFSNGVTFKNNGTQSVTATDTVDSQISGSQAGINVTVVIPYIPIPPAPPTPQTPSVQSTPGTGSSGTGTSGGGNVVASSEPAANSSESSSSETTTSTQSSGSTTTETAKQESQSQDTKSTTSESQSQEEKSKSEESKTKSVEESKSKSEEESKTKSEEKEKSKGKSDKNETQQNQQQNAGYTDREMYAKNYEPGKYSTVVIVFEGKVGVSPYDEKGIKVNESVNLIAGERTAQVGNVY